MNCRWKDKSGNHLHDSFIPEVDKPIPAHDEDLPELQPGEKEKATTRRVGESDNQLTMVLFITTTVAMYMNGSPIFDMFTSRTRK